MAYEPLIVEVTFMDEGKTKRRRAPGEAAGTRRENDAYETQPEVAAAIVDRLARELPTPRRIMEPAAGSGVFVRAAARRWGVTSSVVAVDIDDQYKEACRQAGADTFWHGDFLQLADGPISRCDLVLSNPPFKLAEEFVRKAWGALLPGASIALLLSMTFKGSEGRWRVEGEPKGLFIDCPLRFELPIVPRPTFGMDDSPKFECSLFVWTKDWCDNCSTLDPIRWR